MVHSVCLFHLRFRILVLMAHHKSQHRPARREQTRTIITSLFLFAGALSSVPTAAADPRYCYPDGVFGITDLGHLASTKFCNTTSNAPDGGAYVLASQTILGCAENGNNIRWDMSIYNSCASPVLIDQANCVKRMRDIESCGSGSQHRGGTWQDGCLQYYLDPNSGKCTI